jgi:hypothetical protein
MVARSWSNARRVRSRIRTNSSGSTTVAVERNAWRGPASVPGDRRSETLSRRFTFAVGSSNGLQTSQQDQKA